MGAAYFYHLTRRPLEAVLPQLLDRALAAGWRIAVRGANARRLALLDDALWREPADGFLPHGLQGGPHDDRQPILLTNDPGPHPDRQCLICIEGAPFTPEEVAGAERVCVIFDGGDADALRKARLQWSDLVRAGGSATYWSEESGKWEKKSER
ncbi:DNA polymerase III subunit chi [Oceaniovalibus guishaninsula JLT2003]|uniref:DNA polymerase III subunit chi n=1 Tax=Oceaniovalibus guishaninsula JLT2003 TaxID=1231392 RepID=K2HHA9_9RHOB|nr:DNA polymerase III subunit chi [Oceaniovalibus guishaninsula]EKE45822.1 DNA polymerase III subunit chi [Oceaniovalibus guishaninsula JLT2003]